MSTATEETADTPVVELELAPEDGGRDRLQGISYWIALVLGTVGIVLTINQTFNLHLFGEPIIDTAFYYILLGLFMSLAFLAYPAHRGARGSIPIYDWGLFLLTLASTSYLAWNGGRIIAECPVFYGVQAWACRKRCGPMPWASKASLAFRCVRSLLC
jgi:TRAP-type uncharacterized transport system fused permease subunit